MKLFNKKNINERVNPIFGKLRADLDLDKISQARLRKTILAKASITAQDRPEAVSSYRFQVLVFARIAAVVVLIFACLGGIVQASNSALPGSPLYRVKMTKEKIELQLAATPQQKALVQARHAETRLEELQDLQTKQSPGSNLPAFSPEVKQQASVQVSSAINSLHEVEKSFNNDGNPQQAAVVHTQIEDLRRQARLQGVEAENDNPAVKGSEIRQASSTQPSEFIGRNQDAQHEDKTKARQAVQAAMPTVSADRQGSQKHSDQQEQKDPADSQQDVHGKDSGENKSGAPHVEIPTSTPQTASTTVQSEHSSAAFPAASSTAESSVSVYNSSTTPSRAESGIQSKPGEQSGFSNEQSGNQSAPHSYHGEGDDH